MVKISSKAFQSLKTVEVFSDPTGCPWRVALETSRFPGRAWLDSLKEIPGTKWLPREKLWVLPIEAFPEFEKLAADTGWTIEGEPDVHHPSEPLNVDSHLAETLFDYQYRSAEVAVNQPDRTHLFGDEMGVGKSLQIIASICHLRPTKVLVVSPAIVRRKWMLELREWFDPPGMTFGSIRAGRSRKSITKVQRAAYDANVQFVSWALLPEIELHGWDVIVFDELHKAKNPASKNHRAAKALRKANPQAFVLAATGTPVADRPIDFWGQADLLWPERLGTKWQFSRRYLQQVENPWTKSGVEFTDLRPDCIPELGRRVGHLMTRTTKREIAHLIPPWNVDVWPLDLDIETDLLNPDEAASPDGLSMFKFKPIVEVIREQLEHVDHVFVGVKRLATAKAYGEADYGKGVATRVITGSKYPDADKRNIALEQAKNLPRCVTIATMDSVGIGINLTTYPVAIVAELDDSIEVMEQFLGRFSRIGGKVPSQVWLMVCEGTADERQAENIQKKVSEKNAVEETGTSAEALEKALSRTEDPLESARRLSTAGSASRSEFADLLGLDDTDDF